MTEELASAQGKVVIQTRTVVDLIANLAQTYDEYRAGVIDHTEALTRAKVSNSIIAALRTQIVYDRLKGKAGSIKFLES